MTIPQKEPRRQVGGCGVGVGQEPVRGSGLSASLLVLLDVPVRAVEQLCSFSLDSFVIRFQPAGVLVFRVASTIGSGQILDLMLGRQFDNLVLLFIEVDDNRVRVRHRQAHVIGSGLAAGRRNHLRSR